MTRKGSFAAEIMSADELVLTELVFTSNLKVCSPLARQETLVSVPAIMLALDWALSSVRVERGFIVMGNPQFPPYR